MFLSVFEGTFWMVLKGNQKKTAILGVPLKKDKPPTPETLPNIEFLDS